MTGTNEFGNMPPHPPNRKDPPTHVPFRQVADDGWLVDGRHWRQPEAGFLVTYWNVDSVAPVLRDCVATWEKLP